MSKKIKTTTTLVIVESPAKCKKIEEYLGPGYKCVATYGHLRALVSLKDIDINNTNIDNKNIDNTNINNTNIDNNNTNIDNTNIDNTDEKLDDYIVL